ncbi:hypothetical protein JG688_00011993 [Phytophthora aleatoria]|uniref:Uncharacterized protein n=1 Tax=Phytophthora aleatoria TaxID=2496075 RepID=A0A8J5IL16_9STRA|nr:hypothetical protein JG688_00011993 [Phytophthora aleatoria]
MKEKNLATLPPLESFGPVDDSTAAQVFVPLWKACFQRKRHRDEMDADGDGSVHVSSIQTADGGLARRRILARLRQRRYRERQKRRRLYGNCNGVTRKWLHVATWLHGGFSNVGVRHTNGYTLQTTGLYAFRLPIGRSTFLSTN